MLGQDQPVGAGDLDLRLLERTDYSLEHRASLANQDQHIARQRAIYDPAFHGARDFAASLTDGLVSLVVSKGASQPSLPPSFSSGPIRSQISTSPGMASGKA